MRHNKTGNSAITVAITGASGALYGLRLLETLLEADENVYLLISEAGRIVIEIETGLFVPEDPDEIEEILSEWFSVEEGQLQVFNQQEWTSPVASGSNVPRAMVVCPCSGGTISAIAHGASNNLIERAADVMLKEQRQLILVSRETPLSTIHLENMLKLSRMGVTIMPASPGFYYRPQHVAELVDFMVARVLDHLDVEHDLVERWGQDNGEISD